MPYTAPRGYVDVTEAAQITGRHPESIRLAARSGQIPQAIQRTAKAPWYFTEAGLRRWIGIKDEGDAA